MTYHRDQRCNYPFFKKSKKKKEKRKKKKEKNVSCGCAWPTLWAGGSTHATLKEVAVQPKMIPFIFSLFISFFKQLNNFFKF
jgi:hypothetical protein